ncbi:MAG: pseudouridine synthase [Kiritimatiellae bacterium]|nr:pseudouridine synthase [Kiritimatiellia bacterium]
MPQSRREYRPGAGGRAGKSVSAPSRPRSGPAKPRPATDSPSPESRRVYRPARAGKPVSAPANAVPVSGAGTDSALPNLTKFLSTSGAASRRHAAELIKDGHVSVNGAVCTDQSVRIAPDDRVSLDGERIEPPRGYVYVMLHKPRGYVCTADDPHAPKKALDLIDLPGVRLVSAGRLDKNSEGLILFSNDGAWIEQLTHPRHGTRKTYQVTTDRPLSPADIRRLTTSGVQNDGETLRALSIRAEAPGRYIFILGEGKNREIRRMLESLDNRTRRLKRIAVGSLRLGGLPMGQWRFLSPAEALLALGEAKPPLK